ncbi:MAG: preprotein translocase subunit SecG [Rhodomicrobium sp.]
MVTVLLVIYIMAVFSMIVIILLQRSEGGALGMGGGGGGFVSGRGAANLLTRITAILAAMYFILALALGILGHRPAPISAVGVPVQSAPAGPGENAPQSLPDIKLPKLKLQTPPAKSPAPAQPQLPQSQ